MTQQTNRCFLLRWTTATCLLVFLLFPVTSAYITTSPHSRLPLPRQLDYLHERTQAVVSTPPGQLSLEQVQASYQLLHAWSCCCCSSTATQQSPEDAARHAEQLVQRIVQQEQQQEQTTDTPRRLIAAYTTILQSWAQCGTEASAARAASILEQLEERQWATTEAYTAVIAAYVRCGDCAAATDVLERQRMPPTAEAYRMCLDAWSRAGEPERAEQLLGLAIQRHAKDVVTVPTLNAVLLAWWRTHDTTGRAATRMLEIVAFMERSSSLYPPDRKTYRTLMNAFLHLEDDALPRSLALLDHVWAKQNPKLLKDKILFNGPMGLLAKALHVPDAAQQARQILEYMLQPSSKVRPDVFSITSVLGACSNSRAPEAQTIAMETYELFHVLGIAPSHVSCATMLKVCSRMSNVQQKATWMERVQHDAQRHGCWDHPLVQKRYHLCQKRPSQRRHTTQRRRQSSSHQRRRRAEI